MREEYDFSQSGKNPYCEKILREEEYVDFFKTEIFQETEITPAFCIKTYRENRSWTQAELGEKLEKSRTYISDLENSRRTISKAIAKKLSEIFDVSIERFL